MKSLRILFTLSLFIALALGAQAADSRAVPTKTPAPVVQDELKGVGAKVAVKVVISEDGSVKSATVEKSTDGRFDSLALEAVKRWKFEPAKKDGQPVESTVMVPFNFNA